MAANVVKFAPNGPFRRETEQAVAEMLSVPGVRETAYRKIRNKAIIIGLWSVISYLGLLLVASNWWQVVLFGLPFALSIDAIGFNIMHDGNHGGFSASTRLNRWMGYTLDILGGSSYVWKVKHNTAHHTYTNIDKWDEDIQLAPLGRMSSDQRRYWYHRYQKYYLFLFYGFMTIRWQATNDFRTLIKGKVGQSRIGWPKGWDLFGFVAGKILFLGLFVALPIATHLSWHGALMVLFVFVGVSCVFSFVLALTFQGAHCVDEALFTSPSDVDPETGKMPMEWFEYQVRTTADFCPNNWVITWFMGGLNYQLEHHLFKTENHYLYPAIAEIVQEKCANYGLPYMCQRTPWQAFMAHYRHLRNMGLPPQAVAQ